MDKKRCCRWLIYKYIIKKKILLQFEMLNTRGQ